MSPTSWVIWAFILILQNFAFTFVSRARNSGSLRRHLIAGIFSNGVWFVSQILIFSQLYAIMTGKYGVKAAVFTAVYYTFFTLIGSLLAHYYSLLSEKGKSAVGANKKYAQIPVAEWEQQKRFIAEAYGIATAMLPDSGISARKVEGNVVVNGIESGRFDSSKVNRGNF